jgi:hypothetical protein
MHAQRNSLHTITKVADDGRVPTRICRTNTVLTSTASVSNEIKSHNYWISIKGLQRDKTLYYYVVLEWNIDLSPSSQHLECTHIRLRHYATSQRVAGSRPNEVNVYIYLILLPTLGPGVYSACNRKEYQNIKIIMFLGSILDRQRQYLPNHIQNKTYNTKQQIRRSEVTSRTSTWRWPARAETCSS